MTPRKTSKNDLSPRSPILSGARGGGQLSIVKREVKTKNKKKNLTNAIK